MAAGFLLSSCSAADEGEGEGGADDVAVTSAPVGEATPPVDDTVATTTSPPDQEAETTEAGTVVTVAEGVVLPEGATGEQMQWVIDTLNDPEAPTPTEIRERFTASFLEGVPADELPAVFDQIRGLGPFEIVAVAGQRATLTAQAQASEPLVISLSTTEDGGLDGLLFTPDPTAGREPPTTYEVLEEELLGLGEETHVLAARVQDGACVPVHETAADEAAPIGSVFKLYVLATLVDAVAADDLTWEDELEVTDDIRSLPSGELQDAEPGTTLSVQEAAELMISVSDNTATDLIIEALGVETIEEALSGLGVQDPDGLIPLPTTSQLFRLGWDSEEEVRGAWGVADTAGQRDILEGLTPGVEGIDPQSVTDPRWAEGIDWFADAQDLCAVHVALQERAQTPAGEPVRDILSTNPGSLAASATVDYLGFKGGSAPGAVTYSWYAEPAEGDPVVVVVQVADKGAVDPLAVLGPAQDLLFLLTQDQGR